MLAVCLLESVPASNAQTNVYWDTNNSTTGAGNGTTPFGNWDVSSSTFWSTNSAGRATTKTWTAVAAGNKIANFSAGSTATGSFTVTAVGSITGVAGITFQEGNVTIAGPGTLTLSQDATINTASATGNQTISAAILGGFGITKTGTGTLVVSGANTFTGNTTISAGTLQVGSATTLENSTVLLSGGNATFGALTSATFGGLGGAGNMALTSTGGAVALSVGNNDASTTYSGTLSGSGSLTKIGNGTLTISGANTFTGATNIGTASASGGTVALGASNSLGNGALNIYGGTLAMGANSDSTNGDLTMGGASGTTAAITGTGTLTLGGNVIYNAGSNPNGATIGANLALGSATRTFNIGNSTGASPDLAVTGNISGTGGILKTGAGALTLSGSNSYGGGTTLSAGTLNLASASAIGTGTFTIGNGTTIDNTSGSALTLATNNAQTWNGNYTFTGTNNLILGNGAVSLGTNVTANIANGTLTVGGSLSGAGVGINKTGSGTLVLGGTANSYTGTTTVTSGILSLASLNGASAVTVGNGTLAFTNTGAIASGAPLTLGMTPVLDASGSATVTFGNTGNVAFTAGTGNRTLTLQGTNTGFNILSTALINPSGGALALNKGGTGTWILNGNNSFTGGITISSGALVGYANAKAFGNGTITLAGGTLAMATGNTTGINFGTNVVVTGNAAVTSDLGGFNGAGVTNTLGTLSIGSQTLDVGAGTVYTNSGVEGVTFGSTTLTGNATFNVMSGGTYATNLTLGALNDAGAARLLTVTGNGSLTLGNSATSLVDGTTVDVNGGTIFLNSAGALGTLANVTLGAGTQMTLGAAQTVGGLGGGGTVALGNYALTVGSSTNNLSSSFSGSLQGAGGLVKAGTGTLTLSGASSYTGGTTVNAGTLIAANSSALGSTSAAVTVASGAALGLSGTGNIATGNLTLSGSGVANSGAVYNVAGNNGLSGQIILTDNTSITNNVAGTSLTLSGNILLGSAVSGTKTLTLTPSANATINITGWISDFYSPSGMNLNITNAGNGTLQLGNNRNNYSGNTTIGNYNGSTNGTIQLTANTAIPGSNTITVGANSGAAGSTGSAIIIYSGTLDVGNFTAEAYGQSASYLGQTQVGLILGGGAAGTSARITTGGNGTFVLDKNAVYDGTTGANAATIQGNLQLYGTTVGSNNVHEFRVLHSSNVTNSGTSDYDLTITAKVTEGGGGQNGIEKWGNGTLMLSGANTYSGLTKVWDGFLNAQNSTALGTGNVIVQGGTLQLSNASNGNISLSNFLTLSGMGIGSAGALENVAGANTWTGNILVSSPSAIKADAGSKLTLSGAQIYGGASGTALEIGGNGNVTVNSSIQSSIGDLTKSGNGTVALTNGNSFTGNVAVTGGILSIQHSTALSGYSATPQKVTVSDGATLAFNGGNGSIATPGNNSLVIAGMGYGGVGAINNVAGNNTFGPNAAGGSVTVGTAVGGSTLITANSGTRFSIAGNVSSTAGSGQTLLIGASGYHGNVTIGGVANLGPSTASAMNLTTNGTGTVSINGTSGTSTIGSVNVNGGSTLAFGAATHSNMGTVAVNSSTLTIGSSAQFTSGATNVSSGTYTVGTGANVTTGAFTTTSSTVTVNANATVAMGNLQQFGGTVSLNNGSVTNTGTVAIGSSGALTVAANATMNTGSVSLNSGSISVTGTVNTTGNFTTAASTSLTLASGGLVAVNGNATFSGAVFGPGAGNATLSVTGGGNSLTFNTSINAVNLTLLIGGTSGNALTVNLAGTGNAFQNQLTFGTIHITGDTILDFGDSAGTFLSSANLIIDNGANVTVRGWKTVANNGTNNTAANSTIWYVLTSQGNTGIATGGNVSDGTSTIVLTGSDQKNVPPLTNITFEDPQGSVGSTTTWVDGFHDGWFDHEIRPTPEPSTYGAIFVSACLGVLGFRRYRRKKTAKNSA